jgi:hypothetical protein
MREGTHEVHESVGSAGPVPEQSISQSLEQIAKSGGGKERCGERFICPRCGRPVTYFDKRVTEQGTRYIAVHEKWVKGKRRRKRCWLGSLDKHPELLAYLMRKASKPKAGMGVGSKVGSKAGSKAELGVESRASRSGALLSGASSLEASGDVKDYSMITVSPSPEPPRDGRGAGREVEVKAEVEAEKREEGEGERERVERLVELVSDAVKTLSGLGDVGEEGLRKLRDLVEECLKAKKSRDAVELSPEVVNAFSSLRGLVKGLVDVFKELKGRRVRVVEVSGKKVEGRVLMADEAFLRVEYEFGAGKAVASIPWTSIEKVEELKKRA